MWDDAQFFISSRPNRVAWVNLWICMQYGDGFITCSSSRQINKSIFQHNATTVRLDVSHEPSKWRYKWKLEINANRCEWGMKSAFAIFFPFSWLLYLLTHANTIRFQVSKAFFMNSLISSAFVHSYQITCMYRPRNVVIAAAAAAATAMFPCHAISVAHFHRWSVEIYRYIQHMKNEWASSQAHCLFSLKTQLRAHRKLLC